MIHDETSKEFLYKLIDRRMYNSLANSLLSIIHFKVASHSTIGIVISLWFIFTATTMVEIILYSYLCYAHR